MDSSSYEHQSEERQSARPAAPVQVVEQHLCYISCCVWGGAVKDLKACVYRIPSPERHPHGRPGLRKTNKKDERIKGLIPAILQLGKKTISSTSRSGAGRGATYATSVAALGWRLKTASTAFRSPKVVPIINKSWARPTDNYRPGPSKRKEKGRLAKEKNNHNSQISADRDQQRSK